MSYKIIILTAAIILALSFQGCDSENTAGNSTLPDGQPPAQSNEGGTTKDAGDNNPEDAGVKEYNVSFELPDNWEWLDQNSLEAVWNQPAKGGVTPFVKLEFAGIREGTEADAMHAVKVTYDRHKQSCDADPANCENPPRLKEYEIAGTRIFSAESVDYYYGAAGWNSHLAFRLNGEVIEFMLYDRADHYEEEMATIISSITWKQ